jgi:tol-pal system protein YbgF
MTTSSRHAAARAALLLFTGAALCACAGTKESLASLEARDSDLQDQVTALERSLDAAYDREKSLADRLRRAEEGVAILQARLTEMAAERERPAAAGRPPQSAAAPTPRAFEAADAYAAAWERHQARDYEAAVAAFSEIVEKAPAHSLADNARYWTGEAYYGLGRYRQALAAFTDVLAYETTEKDDDAQLMIGRTYMALGELTQARTAFERLLEVYPDSEYVAAARKDLNYLGAR